MQPGRRPHPPPQRRTARHLTPRAIPWRARRFQHRILGIAACGAHWASSTSEPGEASFWRSPCPGLDEVSRVPQEGCQEGCQKSVRQEGTPDEPHVDNPIGDNIFRHNLAQPLLAHNNLRCCPNQCSLHLPCGAKRELPQRLTTSPPPSLTETTTPLRVRLPARRQPAFAAKDKPFNTHDPGRVGYENDTPSNVTLQSNFAGSGMDSYGGSSSPRRHHRPPSPLPSVRPSCPSHPSLHRPPQVCHSLFALPSQPRRVPGRLSSLPLHSSQALLAPKTNTDAAKHRSQRMNGSTLFLFAVFPFPLRGVFERCAPLALSNKCLGRRGVTQFRPDLVKHRPKLPTIWKFWPDVCTQMIRFGTH